MDFLRIWLDVLVFGILGFMSFLMLWKVLERYWYFTRVDVAQFSHKDALQMDLTHNLTLIATIGSNAPYVGLLGTVLGIMITFYDMGQGGDIHVQSIMTGLALALKATAAGLLVALPAIMFYNGLMRKVEVLMTRWQVLQDS